MKLKAIALDDDLFYLKVVETFCDKIDFIDLKKTFAKSEDAMEYLEKFPVDLIFLDIQMPGISGLDFYKKFGKNTMAIFTTAHAEFAIHGFELSALDYLLKPIVFDRFLVAVQKALDSLRLKIQSNIAHRSFLNFRVDYGLIKVELSEIKWVEAMDDYLQIHLQNKKPLVVRKTMKSLLKRLPSSEFVRIHRSFIVPLHKIQGVRHKIVFMDQKEFPIGTSYEADFMKLFLSKTG